jgi:localization factor PodJL
MHNLAVLYAEGSLGGGPDYATAARWFAEAAAYDIRDSQYNLAVLFERGLGVRTDLPQAYLWYSIADLGGDAEAATRRAALGTRLDEDVRARIDEAALNWEPRPLDPVANGQLSVSRPLGASPYEVARAQDLLIALGYTPGPADGVMGSQTAASIRDFERSAGMAITGRVTPELISRLEAEAAVRGSGG